MRHLKLFLIIVLPSLLFSSCILDPCSYVKCSSGNYYGQFRIVSASDGTDLVFGPSKIYDENQIKFYSLSGIDTIFFEYKTIRFPGTGYDSILHVFFYPKTDVAYMRLSNNDVDTLNLTYKESSSKCCGKFTDITNFRLNNKIDIPGNEGTQEIKK